MINSFEAQDVCWFWATDADQNLTYLSRNAGAQFGEDAEVVGRAITELLDTCDSDGNHGGERPLNYYLRARSRFSDLVVRLHSEKVERWWSLTGRPYFDASQKFIG